MSRSERRLLARLTRKAQLPPEVVQTVALSLLIVPSAAVVLLLMARRYATQQVAARHFNVTDRTVRNWIAEGLITGYRLPTGRAIRVDLDEIEQMVQAIPAATQPKRGPAYPRGRIVTIPEYVESPAAVTASGSDQ